MLALAPPWTTPATASEADDYSATMHRTLALVQFAERGDQPSLHQAITLLEAQPSNGQPEILADLRKSPPDLADADQRLTALLRALEARTDTPDPDLARLKLHNLLSMSRYGAVHRTPSILNQVVNSIIGQILGLLTRLGARSSQLPPIVLIMIACMVLLGILVWAVLSNPRRAPPDAVTRGSQAGSRHPADFFTEADRQAAAGDYLAAIRALAGGVAVVLSGERAWDTSSLTVRELFQRAGRPDTLRPLLLPFEAAAYGHRPPDASTYERATQAAAAFRGKTG